MKIKRKSLIRLIKAVYDHGFMNGLKGKYKVS